MQQSGSLTRIAIVGAGNVGATFAYTLLLAGLAAEIVLIDANQARAEGEAMDLNHAAPFAPSTRVWAGDYQDLAGAAVTVVTAGAASACCSSSSLTKRSAGFVTLPGFSAGPRKRWDWPGPSQLDRPQKEGTRNVHRIIDK